MSAVNVRGVGPLAAWQEGCRHLIRNGGECIHLFTTVDQPTLFDRAWLQTYSPQSLGQAYDSVTDVIQTIFPYTLAQRYPQDRDSFYARYLAIHARAKRLPRNRSAWGTYFERLIRFPGSQVNQLEVAIQKLRTWPRNTTGLVFHLSAPSIDTPRTRGGPCWHFGEILWQPGDILDLSVTYRNHDFFNKALGNFIALGQLHRFLAASTDKRVGKLYCHSVHAFSNAGQQRLQRLAAV